jgi:hypothetical protein
MKNKLLLTSALASGLLAGSAAIAQTTITGDMALVYTAIKKDLAAGAGSTRGGGRETQLNIANKGKLNNGMDYAAGFSLEFDGTQLGNTFGTESASISNENVYVDLISGNTTFTVGVDHIQRGYNGAIPQVFHITEAMTSVGSAVTYVIGAATSESFGAGITQKIPQAGLSLSAYYAPRSRDTGTNDVSAVNSTISSNSSYELGLAGVDTFGIKGLTTSYFYNTADKGATSYPGDVKGTSYGVGYSFGQFAIGADKFINENAKGVATQANQVMGDASLTTTNKHETTRLGATFAVDQNLTLGLVRSKTESTGIATTTNNTETVKAVQVGYNLGPVAVQATYATFDNLMGATGSVMDDNGKLGQIRLTTKF